MIKSAFTRRSILATGSGLALALALTACGGNVAGTSSTADASKFPAGPVTLTIGADPGGSTDLIGRALAENASRPARSSDPGRQQAGRERRPGHQGSRLTEGGRPDARHPQRLAVRHHPAGSVRRTRR